MRGGPADFDANRQNPLRLDADVQIRRLARDREVPRRPSCTSASVQRLSRSSDSSSGTQMKRTRTLSFCAMSCSAHIIAASAPFMS